MFRSENNLVVVFLQYYNSASDPELNSAMDLFFSCRSHLSLIRSGFNFLFFLKSVNLPVSGFASSYRPRKIKLGSEIRLVFALNTLIVSANFRPKHSQSIRGNFWADSFKPDFAKKILSQSIVSRNRDIKGISVIPLSVCNSVYLCVREAAKSSFF